MTQAKRIDRLTAGTADPVRLARRHRIATPVLTAAALCSVAVVCYLCAAVAATIAFPLWVGLGLPAWVLMTFVFGSVGLLGCLPVIIWTVLHSRSIVLRRARSTPPSPAQLQRLQNVAAEMALAAGIPTP